MKKITLVLVIGLFTLCQRGFSISAQEILQNVDENRSVSTNFEMTIRMEDYRKGVLSDNATLTGFVKGLDKSMVAYTEPVNMKGRKILMIKDDMWVFLPDTKKPVRLTASQRLLGQASNGDVVKVRFDYDYSAVMGGEETVADINSENRNCYKLEMSAKRSGATYHSMSIMGGKGDILPC